jgi:hypothetical protein
LDFRFGEFALSHDRPFIYFLAFKKGKPAAISNALINFYVNYFNYTTRCFSLPDFQVGSSNSIVDSLDPD